MDQRLCDKCNKPVPPENDAALIQAIANGRPEGYHFYGARHFLPIGGCEGSPSRAQYIEGQPRDTRGYTYDQSLESKWRTAYKSAQEFA